MSTLVVRRLQVDLDTPLPRHWCGGDAFRTALFDALSMSFPAGEQFFIDAMRMGLAALDPAARAALEPEVRNFIGQEATHRHVHARCNAHLAARGLVNTWERRILARRQRMATVGARNWLAATAGTEHLTAVFSELLLAHPDWLQGAEPRLRDLWLWHSSEEAEHRSTAYDLYRALGGNETWRLRIFRIVTFNFVTDLLRQTVRNLWHDGTWWRAGTWVSGWRMLFGRQGLLRLAAGPWRRYLRPDFHPSQGDAGAAVRWLADHAALAPPVRSSAG